MIAEPVNPNPRFSSEQKSMMLESVERAKRRKEEEERQVREAKLKAAERVRIFMLRSPFQGPHPSAYLCILGEEDRGSLFWEAAKRSRCQS